MRKSDSDSKFKYLSAHKDSPSYDLSYHVMDEFRTLLDRLETENPVIDLQGENAFNQELKRELDEIRMALSDEGEPKKKYEPGQVAPLRKYLNYRQPKLFIRTDV